MAMVDPKTNTDGSNGKNFNYRCFSSETDNNNNNKVITDKNIISAERMTALAMVAAAAESSVGPSKEESLPMPHLRGLSKHGFSSYDDKGQKFHQDLSTSAPVVSASFIGAVAPAAAVRAGGMVEDATTEGSTVTTTFTNQPLLVVGPEPNGCHGKTSRNNAYCRRQPGYKGSKYCKLHYQHYVLAGRGDAEATDKSGVEAVEQTANEKSRSFDSPKVASENLVHHQDKRYTGSPTDIRCKGMSNETRSFCHFEGVFSVVA